jgi:hypothetical protein
VYHQHQLYHAPGSLSRALVDAKGYFIFVQYGVK